MIINLTRGRDNEFPRTSKFFAGGKKILGARDEKIAFERYCPIRGRVSVRANLGPCPAVYSKSRWSRLRNIRG